MKLKLLYQRKWIKVEKMNQIHITVSRRGQHEKLYDLYAVTKCMIVKIRLLINLLYKEDNIYFMVKMQTYAYVFTVFSTTVFA
jgi:hypothetical protein